MHFLGKHIVSALHLKAIKIPFSPQLAQVSGFFSPFTPCDSLYRAGCENHSW